MASTKSSSRALWTTTIVSRRCSTSQRSFPCEMSLHPMLLYRYSGSTWLFITQIAWSTFTADANSGVRCYRLLPSTSRVFFLLGSAMAQSRGSLMSSFVWLPRTSFAMSLKSTTERSSRGSWRAESITLAAGTKTSKVAGLLTMAGLLATAIIATSNLVTPATRTLMGIASPPLRMVSLTSHAICMAPTASIPTTSAARTRRIKQAQTTTATTLKNAPTTCTTMTAATTVATTSCLSPAQVPYQTMTN
jgi:hypothetical protein